MSASTLVPPPLSFAARFAFAWVCFFRVLFDSAFAARIFSVRDTLPLPEGEPRHDEGLTSGLDPVTAEPLAETGALQLLALLQREGRLVDFLEQDVTSFSDADVGVAARVVHDGARKALHAHLTISPVREEDEGARVSIDHAAAAIKLTGNVTGSAPYRGILRHRGWRVTDVNLPTPAKGHDARVLAPAEVEL